MYRYKKFKTLIKFQFSVPLSVPYSVPRLSNNPSEPDASAFAADGLQSTRCNAHWPRSGLM